MFDQGESLMKHLQFEKEVLASWRRCIEHGLVNTILYPVLYLEEDALNTKLQENNLIIRSFENAVESIRYLMKGDYFFLLVSSDGFLLGEASRIGYKQKGAIELKKGISLMEKSIGTSAVDISINLKKAVYTIPEHHYCDFLRTLYFYSTPIIYNGNLSGCLVIADIHTIKSELLMITELLSYRILSECRKKVSKKIIHQDLHIQLGEKQLLILKMLSSGMTEKAIAIETGLNYETIKYHKRKIFDKLNADCTINAIIKALKLNLISLDQL